MELKAPSSAPGGGAQAEAPRRRRPGGVGDGPKVPSSAPYFIPIGNATVRL